MDRRGGSDLDRRRHLTGYLSEVKWIVHHQEYVDIVGLRLVRQKGTEDDGAGEVSRLCNQIKNSLEAHAYDSAPCRRGAESFDDFLLRTRVDAVGKVTSCIEGREWHVLSALRRDG